MNEIKCPHCGNVFKVDESDYESLLNQVRNEEFHKELELREKALKDNNKNLIVTAWLNHKKDAHFTLDDSKYCSEEFWVNSVRK